MKDMFINYDNNIDKKILPIPAEKRPTELLESDPTLWIVQDVFGKEIGVKVKHNFSFSLYFYLDSSCSKNAMLDEDTKNYILESSIIFEIIDHKHNVVLTKEYAAKDIYDYASSELRIDISQIEARQLDIDSYRIRLTMGFPGGSYELYSESDGLLIVR